MYAIRSYYASAVFTTHTPVPAGNETFDTGLVRRHLAAWAERGGLSVDRVVESYNFV